MATTPTLGFANFWNALRTAHCSMIIESSLAAQGAMLQSMSPGQQATRSRPCLRMLAALATPKRIDVGVHAPVALRVGIEKLSALIGSWPCWGNCAAVMQPKELWRAEQSSRPPLAVTHQVEMRHVATAAHIDTDKSQWRVVGQQAKSGAKTGHASSTTCTVTPARN